MKDLAVLIFSGLVVYTMAYPLIEWIQKIKEEMEEKDHGKGK